MKLKDAERISIVPFNSRYREAFFFLNREWIEERWELEKIDYDILKNPEASITEVGGEIFFALVSGAPVGTCAMIPHGPRTYELAKMAVTKTARGKGCGHRLMDEAIQWARSRNAIKVVLCSNRKLASAIHLYGKYGFVEAPGAENYGYDRVDIAMELLLNR